MLIFLSNSDEAGEGDAPGRGQRAPLCKSAAVKCKSSCLEEVYLLSAVTVGDGSLTYLLQGSIRYSFVMLLL